MRIEVQEKPRSIDCRKIYIDWYLNWLGQSFVVHVDYNMVHNNNKHVIIAGSNNICVQCISFSDLVAMWPIGYRINAVINQRLLLIAFVFYCRQIIKQSCGLYLSFTHTT